ncbi:peptide-N4-asparagine amidase [Allobranchiibius huperziae]|uniref:Peptide N-acetyl-beta-D-glucosaminyl asparaginase amidase A N-terminal domain-containing protein n=1 Tax=Allobranchiibius huperziae TaxID=1874116 RepID=A0A853DDI9_9MICO|nr:hypothetical protein [Allobranchiibius huperziae]
MRRRLSILLTVVLSLLASCLIGAQSASAAGYIENGADNPVSAAPPISRPATGHCTATLASHFPSNAASGSAQNYSGTLAPPAACAGKAWSKVVLDSTTSVSGRQYDRSGTLTIGGVTVWFGTTQEPGGPTPTTFSFSKDITDFSALLRTPQPFTGGYVNYTDSTYTGVYDQTVHITYYLADSRHPAPSVPDKVVGVPVQDLNPASHTTSTTVSGLPRNITGARLDVTLKGNGCDEQWFTAVPDAVAADYPDAGLCAAGSFREATVAVDGTRAGAVGTYPHIYSGGIVPTLWRPVLAIDTLDLRAESLDLTPFAGRLVDGKSHTLTFAISPIGDTWNVTAALFLYTDHHRARTSGSLTSANVAAAATTDTTVDPARQGAVHYSQTARRADSVTGYIDTSAGRVVTTVSTGRTWSNAGAVSDSGAVQSIRQQDLMTTRSVSRVGARTVRSLFLRESYPITVDFSAADYTDDQNFSLTGTVTMAQDVARFATDGRHATGLAYDWRVSSYGVLARSKGVTSESDGHSTTSYIGTGATGRPYWHVITTNHGRVTSDRHLGV